MKKIIIYVMVYFSFTLSTNARMVDTFMDACEKGSMQGCYQAGVVYWTGEGAQKDRQSARLLLQISCDGGYSDACVALRTLNEEDSSASSGNKSLQAPIRKSIRYSRHMDGKFQADIDQDGKEETVGWKKFATTDLGDYYQLLVLDDDGSHLWKGPKEKDEGNPYIFSSLDIGVSLPELLTDIDNDGYIELLAPAPQSDVSPTYYRKIRWRGTYFEALLSSTLTLSSQSSNRFLWKRTSKSYGTWISKLIPYSDGLIKANVKSYRKGQSARFGVALIRFNREGAEVYKWIQPIISANNVNTHRIQPPNRHRVIGIVYGLDTNGDGFLSIRKKPNSTEIGRLHNGDKIEILGRKDKWFKIRDARSGRVGWSHSNWIRRY